MTRNSSSTLASGISVLTLFQLHRYSRDSSENHCCIESSSPKFFSSRACAVGSSPYRYLSASESCSQNGRSPSLCLHSRAFFFRLQYSHAPSQMNVLNTFVLPSGYVRLSSCVQKLKPIWSVEMPISATPSRWSSGRMTS